MGKEEESHLKFLPMARRDLESCSNDKSQQIAEVGEVKELKGEEGGVVPSHTVFWICVAAMLLLLSMASGTFQVCQPSYVERRSAYFRSYEVPLQRFDSESVEDFFDEPRFSELVSSRDVYQGEAIVHDGRAYLTSQLAIDEKGVIASPHSVGRLFHSQFLQMKHRGPKFGEETVASFQVTFVFSIEMSIAGREATGDGFAFVMVPEGNVMGSAGGSLGLMDLDKSETHHTFAVEFDTWKNPYLHDISNNHVGINVNSMVSVVAEEAGYWATNGNERHAHEFRPLDLTSGKIQAWIDYDGMSHELTVRISPLLGRKPYRPLLRKSLDLSKVLNKYMSVGFSAATGDFAAKHIIHSWHFEESSTLQHFQSAPNVHIDQASVLPVASEQRFQMVGLPRDHVSNLPAYRNPRMRRDVPQTKAAALTGTGLPTSEVERTTEMGVKEHCSKYLPNFPEMDFVTFKEHFFVNSLWVLLGLAAGLLFIHSLFIFHHILVECYDACGDREKDSLRMVDGRVLDQYEEEESNESRYALVVVDSQQYQ